MLGGGLLFRSQMVEVENTMTISEAAKELNLKTHQVRKRIARKDLKAQKLGWIWLIERGSVEQLKKKLAIDKR